MPTASAASRPRGDNGTLTTVAPENFPAEGVEVLLPYPQDSGQQPRGTVERSLRVQRRPAPLHNGKKKKYA